MVIKRKGIMSIINETVKLLESQRASAEKQVAALTSAINALSALGTGAAPKAEPVAIAAKPVKKGGMSAEGRARIVAAQKARWAAVKAGKPATKPVAAKPAAKAAVAKPATPAKKSGMTAAGRARLIAAVKARWAALKAGKMAVKPVATKPAAKPVAKAVVAKPAKKKSQISAAGRAKIAAAQKARWAKIKGAKAAAAKN